MSYTVLARRYRSKDFDDLIGQEPIARTLCNAIQSNRVAHAYLFCGTRGVGKTSAARILAKSLNCVNGPTVKPCNQCERCVAIAAGEDIDVIEIDGASNRGIDEIRNLRNNAIYRPARAPYKIYIIDEVHMLTKEAFNALLKTLEEPPSHVKFIFATTEPQRVPQTISSRCQEFHFRLIPTAEIARRLEAILKAEKIAVSDREVVGRVARAGRGSMRDALSLMDQLLSMGAEKISEETVEYLLGAPAVEQLLALTGALADGDAAAALAGVDQLLAAGYAPEQFIIALIEHLRRLMLLAVAGEACEFLEAGAAERKPLAEQAARFNAVTLVYMIQLLEQLRQSVRTSSPAARALIDAAIVRLALADQFADTAELVERLEGGADSTAAGAGVQADAKKKFQPPPAAPPPRDIGRPSEDEPPPADADSVERPLEDVGPTACAPAGGGDLGPPLIAARTSLDEVAGETLWNQIIGRLSRARMMTLVGPLQFVRLVGASGSALRLSGRGDFRQILSLPQRQAQLQQALSHLLARAVTVEWSDGGAEPLPTAEPAAAANVAPAPGAAPPGPAPAGGKLSKAEVDQILADATVRTMLDRFDGRVVSVERKGGG